MVMTTTTIALGVIGPQEVILIVLIAILIFGGKKIPELMKGIGQGMKEFKKATRSEDEIKKTESQTDSKIENQ